MQVSNFADVTGGDLDSIQHMIKLMQPLHPFYGVEAIGLNLVSIEPAKSAIVLSELVAQYGLVVVRDQVLSPKLHVEIARQMGTVEVHRPNPTQIPGITEVYRLAWSASDGHVGFGCYWHADGCARPNPTRLSIYQVVVIPEYGGHTYFVDSAVVWKSLPSRWQKLLRSLRWRHVSGVLHPFVRNHPQKGSEHLIVNLGKTESIEGLSTADSNEIIKELAVLIEGSSAVVQHHWLEGDVLIADNWAVLHRATPPVEGQQRILHRVSVLGT